MNIGVLALYDDKWRTWAEAAALDKAKYCNNQGYTFILQRGGWPDARPSPWWKIYFLQKYLPHFDWMFWTDGDSIIANHSIRLETFLDDNFNIIIAKDHNGINSGHFLIKNTLWSLSFLDRVYNRTDLIDVWPWEQRAMAEILDKEPEHCKIVPMKLFNHHCNQSMLVDGFGRPERNCDFKTAEFIVHFGGIEDQFRWKNIALLLQAKKEQNA